MMTKRNRLSTEDNRLSMAPMRGFEPPACRLGGGRSILLSYMGRNSEII